VGRGLLIWLLCLGAVLLLFYGGHVNPVVYLVAGVLAPLPVILTGWRLGERAALLLALAAVLCIFAPKPGLEVVLENLAFGNLLLMGVLISCLRYRGVSPERTIILTTVALNLVVLVFILSQAFYANMSLQALLGQKGTEVVGSLRRALGGVGDGASDLVGPGVSQAAVEFWVQRLLPGLVILNGALSVWVNVVISRQIAGLLGWGEESPPLFYWSAPEWLIFVVLGAGFLLLFPVTAVRVFSLNLLMVLALLYFCQGVAVVAALFHRWELPRLLRLIGYFLVFLNPFIFLIITLGLMDIWLDFRRLQLPGDA
jgi:uncharacterized protein YybS (DUF2232 family)